MAHTSLTSEPDNAWCTIVVPCYNEAARLQPDVFLQSLDGSQNLRFVFVNDGSSDQTLSVLRSLESKAPGRIVALDRQPNAGKAEAVRTGLLHAISGSSIVGFWDADLATPLTAIQSLHKDLEDDPRREMVFGSRVRLLGRRIHRNELRHYVGRIFATVVSTTLSIPIYDSQCGAKLFRVTSSLEQVLQQTFQSRWIFDVEILARFLALHRHEPDYATRAIYEHPLDQWTEIPGSKVSPLDFVNSLFEILQIRARYLRG